jgi:hypothetical protein
LDKNKFKKVYRNSLSELQQFIFFTGGIIPRVRKDACELRYTNVASVDVAFTARDVIVAASAAIDPTLGWSRK